MAKVPPYFEEFPSDSSKCNGLHSMPVCESPECWQRNPIAVELKRLFGFEVATELGFAECKFDHRGTMTVGGITFGLSVTHGSESEAESRLARSAIVTLRRLRDALKCTDVDTLLDDGGA